MLKRAARAIPKAALLGATERAAAHSRLTLFFVLQLLF
jgi:hypothetical protein